jgi:hypothetical protein
LEEIIYTHISALCQRKYKSSRGEREEKERRKRGEREEKERRKSGQRGQREDKSKDILRG